MPFLSGTEKNLTVQVLQLFNVLYLLLNVGGAVLFSMAIGKQNFGEVNRIYNPQSPSPTKEFMSCVRGAMASPYVTGVQPVAPSAKVAAEGVLHELTAAEYSVLLGIAWNFSK